MHVVLVYRGRYHVREALDLEGLAPVLRGGGYRVTLVYDPDTFGVTDNVLQVPWLARRLSSSEKIIDRIVAAGPDVAVFSVLPSTYAWAREIAGLLKARIPVPVPTVFVGLHPSLAAERVSRDACVDYVIEGEVEGVINPLLEAIASRADMSDVECDVSGIGNLWYGRNGDVRHTFRAELVDLDALPLPDKDLFAPYVSHTYSYAAMVSRGCPYQCTFCEETCSKKLYGGRYFRRKSVDTVMAELIEAKRRYNFREVIFKDSYLSGNKKWLAELMRRYRREIGVPFKCFCTILGFDEETASLLKRGGCYNIEFGLQTWNYRIRRDVLHRRETNEDALRAFDCCARQHLWYDVDHMFNLPGESEQDHLDGVWKYRSLRYLNRIKNHFLVYLPSAEIVDYALQEGVVPEDIKERLAEGWESDFYDQSQAASANRQAAATYAALYKLLPVLPKWLVRWLLERRRVRWFARVPSMVMAPLQGLLALRSRDLRFRAYLRLYPAKTLRAVRELMTKA